MRFVYFVSAVVFLAISGISSASTASVPERRFLRVTGADTDTEERASVNVDLIIKDTTSKVASAINKATAQKLKFAVWKASGKTPQQLYQDLGLAKLGQAAIGTKKWKKLKAYETYYGKGPRTYP